MCYILQWETTCFLKKMLSLLRRLNVAIPTVIPGLSYAACESFPQACEHFSRPVVGVRTELHSFLEFPIKASTARRRLRGKLLPMRLVHSRNVVTHKTMTRQEKGNCFEPTTKWKQIPTFSPVLLKAPFSSSEDTQMKSFAVERKKALYT